MSDVKITVLDGVSPAIDALLRRLGAKSRVLGAMGAVFAARSQSAFRRPEFRPAPWLPTQRANPPLIASGLLWQSIRMLPPTSESVAVVTDRPYAVFHQLGAKAHTVRPKNKKALFWAGLSHPVGSARIPKLPARPFFQVDAAGSVTPGAERAMLDAAAKTLSESG